MKRTAIALFAAFVAAAATAGYVCVRAEEGTVVIDRYMLGGAHAARLVEVRGVSAASNAVAAVSIGTAATFGTQTVAVTNITVSVPFTGHRAKVVNLDEIVTDGQTITASGAVSDSQLILVLEK